MQAGKKQYQKKGEKKVAQKPKAEPQASGGTFLTEPTHGRRGQPKKQSSLVLQDPEEKSLEQKALNMEMEDSYSDDDFTIYFDRAQLLNHLNHLEDDNLFRIKLVEDDQQAVKKIKEDAQVKYKIMERDIEEVDKSIAQLEKTKETLMSKNRYLSGSVNQQQAVDKNEEKDRDGPRTIKKKSLTQTLMDMDPTCTKEQCDKFNRLVTEILKSCQIDDDRSSMVEPLTKIEKELNHLAEARNILNEYDKLGKLPRLDGFQKLVNYETHVTAKRMEKKFQETQEENLKKEQEMKQRQREKAEKARNQVLFRGLPLVPRSTKKAFKPVAEKKVEMSPNTRDNKQYLDPDLFDVLTQFQKEHKDDQDEEDEKNE